ncbi:MAG: hypothetical protein ACM30H_06725 [Clostridia bacterium]
MEIVYTIEPAQQLGNAGFAIYRHEAGTKSFVTWFTSYEMAAQAYPDAKPYHPSFKGFLRHG